MMVAAGFSLRREAAMRNTIQKIREKKHRLDPELYRGRIVVGYTICVEDRKKPFKDQHIFSQFEQILLSISKISNVLPIFICLCLIIVIFYYKEM